MARVWRRPSSGRYAATFSPHAGRREWEISMQRYAFKMFLNHRQAHEYRRRHDALWPELSALLSEFGRQQLFDFPRSRNQHAVRLSRAHRRPSDGGSGQAPGDASLVGAHEGHHGRQSRRQPSDRAPGRDVSSGVRAEGQQNMNFRRVGGVRPLLREAGKSLPPGADPGVARRAGWGAESRDAKVKVRVDARAMRPPSAATAHTPSGASRHLPQLCSTGCTHFARANLLRWHENIPALC